MKEWKAEVITVGTELLLGQIVNTNVAWVSEKLADNGISVYYHQVVGDNLNRVKDVFEIAHHRSNIIFVTGGLGPTDDDLTREAFQEISGIKIIEDEQTMKDIEAYFRKRNLEMTPNNRKQAAVFEGSTVFKNPVGIAPGILVDYDDRIWIFMPGVPREMKALTEEQILPYFKKKNMLEDSIYSRVLRFIGIGEAQIEHELKDIIHEQTNPTIAPLAVEGEVSLRLTAKAKTEAEANTMFDQIEDKVIARVGEFLYGYNEMTIRQRVYELLLNQQLTLASAESLTGGAFSAEIVQNDGASKVFKGGAVVYHEQAKENVLQVDSSIIDEYGTVSKECAIHMAKQVASLYGSDIGISFTGVAGSVIENQSHGTVFICIYDKINGKAITEKFVFQGNRSAIIQRTVKKGLELLYKHLNK
ncbi:nicotinamide-nucleotide amidase [Gracilibacillus halotolerans]|uniref:Putative competence-damage inducible protein n=1 Tax=Gracilibacillus halotolerans TaxID=74386 RepID=A0A841RKK7_9BACI|nr:competence/damage-inducible protein A [Gracilibacillus halotolerans]MBB6511504.1 nicotinamide-nucleotide amidase [Gracilibacillus halotolerans]